MGCGMGGRWTVEADGYENEPLFAVEAAEGGMVSLHIPSPDPVIVTPQLAHKIRSMIGLAIGEAHAGGE